MRVTENADKRLGRTANDPGDREHQPDLGVAQPKVSANQGPGGRADSADELVQELDREQDRDGCAGGSAPAGDPELPGRVSAKHRAQLTSQGPSPSTAERSRAGARSQ